MASVLAQTYGNFELIVVIDGADPATQCQLTHIGDPRLRVVALEKPVGGSEARNTGAREAAGRWVAFLDDDDEWVPEKLEKQLRLAPGDGQETLIVCEFILRSPGAADQVLPRRLPFASEPPSEFMFSSACGFQTSTYLCQRSLVLRVPFTKGLKKHQDYDWYLRVLNEPGVRLAVVKEPLAIWHHSSSIQRVSLKEDWEFTLGWGKSRRHLMTGRGYSYFVVKICAKSARTQGAGEKVFWQLFRECLSGAPTPRILGQLLVMALLPKAWETQMRRQVAALETAGLRLVP